MIRSVHDLDIFQQSKDLFVRLVPLLRRFPKEASYLVSQISRAANSIHANIAEGFGRSTAEFKKYLTTALGSNNEVLSHLEDAVKLGYLRQSDYQIFCDGYTTVGKKVFRLREKWQTRP